MNEKSLTRSDRRWRTYSLRTLLVVTAIIAVLLAFLFKPYSDRRSAVAKIDSLHGGYAIVLEAPSWLRDRIVENKWFYNLSRVSIGPACDGYDPSHPFDDDALRVLIPHLNEFSVFRTLHIPDTPITDVGIRYMRELNNLEELIAPGTQISDAGLADLATFGHLRSLDVRRTNVTADGVARFSAALPNCKIMWRKR
jgi:hypothetical protein